MSTSESEFPWDEWVISLYRPPRFDDEEPPESYDHVPYWNWRQRLEKKYGTENVDHKAPYLVGNADWNYENDVDFRRNKMILPALPMFRLRTEPAFTDSCVYAEFGRTQCKGSCKQ